MEFELNCSYVISNTARETRTWIDLDDEDKTISQVLELAGTVFLVTPKTESDLNFLNGALQGETLLLNDLSDWEIKTHGDSKYESYTNISMDGSEWKEIESQIEDDAFDPDDQFYEHHESKWEVVEKLNVSAA